MKESYEIINICEAGFTSDSCPLIINYCLLERFYFPILVALTTIGISSWLLVEISSERMPPVVKSALLTVVMLLSCLLFWYAIRHGSFVVVANYKGIYYNDFNDKSKLVFIRWEAVNKIAMYNDGSRELEIETVFKSTEILPKPCNGTSFVKDGRLAVSLYPGLTRKTSVIMDRIADLRRLQDCRPEDGLSM